MPPAALLILLATLLLAPSLAWAGNACDFGVEPETSGLPLNPIPDKLTDASARPSAPGNASALMVGGQILALNKHVVAGARALKVRGYFKQVEDGESYILKVKRGDNIVLVSTR